MAHLITPQILLLISPKSFGYNTETARSNAFQVKPENDEVDIQNRALNEFDSVVTLLKENEIEVLVYADTDVPAKPDALFPNNWISTLNDGSIILYPMLAENRRLERRADLVDDLKKRFKVNEVIDISENEKSGKILEGTGSIVFDHASKTAFACRSPRTNEELLNQLCNRIGYTSIVFDAADEKGNPIYHTNVMMWIGEKVASVCLDSIRSDDDQERILNALTSSGHKIVAISYHQMNAFAGNMFEVTNRKGQSFVLMSQTAYHSLLPGQLNEITRYSEPLIVSIDTIEKYGGGGIRCMVAGIYLPEKP